MGKQIVASKANAVKASWNALRAEAAELYRRGRIKSACAVQQDLVEQLGTSSKRDDYALLSLYHFSAGMEKAAADIIEEALKRWPDDPEFLANIGISYLRANIFDKAEHWLTCAVAISPDAPNLHDGLARLYMENGDLDRAVHHGERALELKDLEAARAAGDSPDISNVPVPGFDSTRPERNIIAFSLWGSYERYLSAAVTNARLAPHIYPGWAARFYCEESVPETTLAELLSEGAEVILRPSQASLYEGLFWRFAPAFEDGVDRYLVRDADSVISVRERLAVEDWIASGKHFHVMRDFLTHTDPILAGLWGGTGGSLPAGLKEEFTGYLTDPGKTANCDQKFLREKVWPIARQSCLIHDSHFQVLGAKPFPGGDGIARDTMRRGHIGSSEHVRGKTEPPVLRGHTSTGTFQKRERFVIVLAPCRALLKAYLAQLPEEAKECEVRTLDAIEPASVFQREGNSRTVNGYWQRQTALLRSGPAPEIILSSSGLLFSGLMENVGLLCKDAAVEIILLHASIAHVAKAITHADRLLSLDAARRIIKPEPFASHGDAGHMFWHAAEALTRMAFYKIKLAELPNLTFDRHMFTELSSTSASSGFGTQIDRIAASFKREPDSLALRFARNGGWLG